MSDVNDPAEWYYVGHYGQLGPLTLAQMNELAIDGVIATDTYVWKQGMADWATAGGVTEFRSSLGVVQPEAMPPSVPGTMVAPSTDSPAQSYYGAAQSHVHPVSTGLATQSSWHYIQTHAPKSDKSKVLAGVLNMVIPGVGRLYLGYAAHGVLQLFLTMCVIGAIWSFIDGIYILAGGVKLDGYGRRLED